jgi:hypothetical protein
VRRNCSQGEIDEVVMNPELVHHCREHMFASGELRSETAALGTGG